MIANAKDLSVAELLENTRAVFEDELREGGRQNGAPPEYVEKMLGGMTVNILGFVFPSMGEVQPGQLRDIGGAYIESISKHFEQLAGEGVPVAIITFTDMLPGTPTDIVDRDVSEG